MKTKHVQSYLYDFERSLLFEITNQKGILETIFSALLINGKFNKSVNQVLKNACKSKKVRRL